MGANGNIFDEHIKKLIRCKVRQFAGRVGLKVFDCEDLEQDLTLHLIEHLDQFDPVRGGITTFVCKAIDHKLISIMRHRFAMRRDCRCTVPLADQNGDGTQPEPVDARGVQVNSRLELSIDVHQALAGLNTDAQAFCILLKEHSIAETARSLGLTRGQARSQVKKIRVLLTDAGLAQ